MLPKKIKFVQRTDTASRTAKGHMLRDFGWFLTAWPDTSLPRRDYVVPYAYGLCFAWIPSRLAVHEHGNHDPPPKVKEIVGRYHSPCHPSYLFIYTSFLSYVLNCSLSYSLLRKSRRETTSFPPTVTWCHVFWFYRPPPIPPTEIQNLNHCDVTPL